MSPHVTPSIRTSLTVHFSFSVWPEAFVTSLPTAHIVCASRSGDGHLFFLRPGTYRKHDPSWVGCSYLHLIMTFFSVAFCCQGLGPFVFYSRPSGYGPPRDLSARESAFLPALISSECIHLASTIQVSFFFLTWSACACRGRFSTRSSVSLWDPHQLFPYILNPPIRWAAHAALASERTIACGFFPAMEIYYIG